MNELSCEDVAEMAPELVLGVLEGPDRAEVLSHVDSCTACRQIVEQLSDTADSLYALAPPADPPLGFETRVASRLRPARQPRRRRLVAAVGAAAVLSSGLTAAIVNRRDAADTRLTREYVAALKVLGGRSLRASPLLDADGRRAGEIFIYDGHPSWWFVALDGPSTAPLVLEMELTSGRRLRFNPDATTAARSAWGMKAVGSLTSVRAARLVHPDGTVVYRAEGLRS